MARLPDVIAPSAGAAMIVDAIAAVGDDLNGNLTIVEPTRVRVFGSTRA